MNYEKGISDFAQECVYSNAVLVTIKKENFCWEIINDNKIKLNSS